jgi:DHA2 family multidrug resistance protein-like MFS transporter
MIVDDGLPNPRRLLAFLAIAAAVTMAVLDSSVINVALPVISQDLGTGPATAIWVVNAFQITVMISLLPLAALAESLGCRLIYCTGLVVFTAGSLACALSPTFSILVAARVLQGLGAAGIMSVNPALIRFIYPANLLGRGFGRAALVVGVASAAGPTVAAAVLSVASWPWLYLINVPLGILALSLAAYTLPETPRTQRQFDWLGAALNAITFSLFILGVTSIRNDESMIHPMLLLVGAVLIGFIFVRHQMAHPMPLLPLDLLKLPVFALSMMASVCSFAAQALAYISLPFYFHDVLGRSVAETGLLLTPFPLMVAIAASVSGRLADRYSPSILGGIGLAILACGLGLLALLPSDSSNNDVIWRLAICGFGFGLFQTPNNKVILTSGPRERSGGAGGLLATARLLGQSLGAALVAALLSPGLTSPTSSILWLGAALAAFGCIASSLRVRGRTHEP